MAHVQLRTPSDLGALIRDRRRVLGLDQAELAGRIGVSRLWINQIEKGKPGASLGLVLRALDAVGANLWTDLPGNAEAGPEEDPVAPIDLDAIVAAHRTRDRS